MLPSATCVCSLPYTALLSFPPPLPSSFFLLAFPGGHARHGPQLGVSLRMTGLSGYVVSVLSYSRSLPPPPSAPAGPWHKPSTHLPESSSTLPLSPVGWNSSGCGLMTVMLGVGLHSCARDVEEPVMGCSVHDSMCLLQVNKYSVPLHVYRMSVGFRSYVVYSLMDMYGH